MSNPLSSKYTFKLLLKELIFRVTRILSRFLAVIATITIMINFASFLNF